MQHLLTPIYSILLSTHTTRWKTTESNQIKNQGNVMLILNNWGNDKLQRTNDKLQRKIMEK